MTTINPHVCAILTYGGDIVHFDTPEQMPLRIDQIKRRGKYIGAYHTDSLKQAQSTIFLEPVDEGRSPMSPIAIYVSESLLVLEYSIAAARLAGMTVEKAKLSLVEKPPVAPVAHAAHMQPRRQMATASSRGGF